MGCSTVCAPGRMSPSCRSSRSAARTRFNFPSPINGRHAMQNKNREALLKIAVGAVIGLFLLDRMIIGPFFSAWKNQGERIAEFRQKVQRGQQLLDRETSLRNRWAEMQKNDLADDSSSG